MNVPSKSVNFNGLREFVFANERHPESVRVFAWLRAAGGVAGSGGVRRRVPIWVELSRPIGV